MFNNSSKERREERGDQERGGQAERTRSSGGCATKTERDRKPREKKKVSRETLWAQKHRESQQTEEEAFWLLIVPVSGTIVICFLFGASLSASLALSAALTLRCCSFSERRGESVSSKKKISFRRLLLKLSTRLAAVS
jgi:hypothetical protein